MAAAVDAHRRDPLSSSQVVGRALSTLLAALVFLLLLLAVLAGGPALWRLSFDLVRLLPRGAAVAQVFALVVIVGIVPLIAGVGPVFGALWILSLAWLHLATRERVLTALLGVLCLALPLGVDAVARLACFPGSRTASTHRALFDAHAEPLRHALAARPPAELDPYERAALAMWHKREGRLEEARRLFAEVVDTPSGDPSDLAFAHGGLGVIAALRGEEATALDELGRTIVADPRAYAAAFNASLLHFRAFRTDKADSAIASMADAPALLNAFRRTTYRVPDQAVSHNRAFIDVYPSPLSMLRAGLLSTNESRDTARTIARVLLWNEVGTRALTFLAVFPLFWLVLSTQRKKIDPAQSCVRCGDAASRRIDGGDVPPGTCSSCYHCFMSRTSRADAGVTLRRERAIARRHARLRTATVMLAVLMPGAGHIFGGAVVRGVFFATWYALGLAALLFASGIVPMPQLAGPWSHSTAMVAPALFLGIVWLLAMRSAWILAADVSRRGRRP
jgi:hypothetical protein